MYRLAIISDVHADVHALTDALSEIDRLGCDAVVCCGDIVDYGLFPDETIELLAARRVPTVRGNHDRWAVEGGGHGGGWDLSRASRRWLSALPSAIALTIDGVRVAVHHGSPFGDQDGLLPEELDQERGRTLLDEARADVLLVGHTHVAFAFAVAGGGLIANPAALLRSPADADEGPPATASFAVLELPSLRFEAHQLPSR